MDGWLMGMDFEWGEWRESMTLQQLAIIPAIEQRRGKRSTGSSSFKIWTSSQLGAMDVQQLVALLSNTNRIEDN